MNINGTERSTPKIGNYDLKWKLGREKRIDNFVDRKIDET